MPLPPLLETLKNKVVLADGGIGTQIYERGIFINRSFDELNLTNASLIKKIHSDYVAAGADLIETNTFRANRQALGAYGLEDLVEKINRTAVALARESAGDSVYVAGSVGPLGVRIKPVGRISIEEARSIFAEQVAVLDDAGVDCIILETFLSIDELEIAYRAARDCTKKPIIAEMSFQFTDAGELEGVTPEEAATAMANWGVDVIGTNCVNGPEAAVRVVERMRSVTDLPISAMPNAGLPQVVEGRTLYMATPEYMAEYARRLVQKGANLVGGCCGTTPADIAEMRIYLQSIAPMHEHSQIIIEPIKTQENIEPIPTANKSRFAANLKTKFQISVEVDPPKGLDPTKTIAGAKFLAAHGVDAVNIADGARAIPRMAPMALARRIRDEVEIETIIHYCCRDRNVLGMQMDLIGANALEINNLLIVTGDPPKMGNFPHATAVFDVDAIGLLHFASMLNHGYDLSGRSLGEPANLLLGCGCNPGAINLDLEINRFGKKIAAGAEYVFSQPVYDPEKLEVFLNKSAHFPEIPFFVGILPLASLRNAEFLHNEVPGMQIPKDIMERMRKAGSSKTEQRLEGIRIAQEALLAARKLSRVNGAYIFPPFGSYEAVIEVLSVL